jgi:sortase A
MGKRSDRRKFRRRRRWAGFFVLLSPALVVFGVMLIRDISSFDLRATISWGAKKTSVARVESVRMADAPEAISGQKTDEAARNQVAQEPGSKPNPKPPAIPTPPTDDLWMSIPALGLYNVYVTNTSDPREGHAGPETPLDYGLIKLAETGFPWQPNANTYIVGHRLGWPGTGSYHIFYNLPLLAQGDKIYLGDVNGTTYTYEVTEFHEITPNETWITGPQAGRDMVSLQTCIENFGDYWTMGPNWYVRYIVQADRVSVDVAK